ncbi:MAG: cytochrome C oxidase subunit IV family protein [Armatimonadetes bacterium]|nr:cytochrome C oxidase subunit IV family protein [Armatimonadota bacterium]
MAKSPLHADDHGHHIHPVGMYVRTGSALMVLMGLTVLAARVDFGDIVTGGHHQYGYYVNNLVAILIAAIKAFLVVMFFMHIKWSSSTAKVWALTGFFFLPILFSVFADYFTRSHEVVNGWTGSQMETALPRVIGENDQAPLDPKSSNNQNRNPRSSLW